MPDFAGLIPGQDGIENLSFSWTRSALIAEASVAWDIQEDNDQTYASSDRVDSDDEADAQASASTPNLSISRTRSLVDSYRRPSFSGAGNRAAILPQARLRKSSLSWEESRSVIEEERDLLHDNDLIQVQPSDDTNHRSIASAGSSATKRPSMDGSANNNAAGCASENTTLLASRALAHDSSDIEPTVSMMWAEAVAAGKIETTWQREAKVILRYAGPLTITFLLQYSLTVVSVFTVGHIGVAELGAVSLASMTANITGYAVYQGLATSLDTLCAQAYGSGHKTLVGLQTQRMIWFLWLITVPIAGVWLAADTILVALVPEAEVAHLAGIYLKIVLAGAPGYAAFEAGKRYCQAQGLFSASLWVLIFCAPFNAFMNWFLVWYMGWGFTGAPIAVAITDNLLPVGLILYLRFGKGDGLSCWNGFTKKSFHNWRPMIKLAIPGLIMIEAECLAFEILTFAASYFGQEVLAAQSVLTTISLLTFQIPFPLSIAGSTRVANLIGATLADSAKITMKVTVLMAILVGFINVTLLSVARDYIPRLFTDDRNVAGVVSQVLPLCAAFQLFDSLAACCNGMLRGLGWQEFGGYVQLLCYYVFALPISFGLAFGAGWSLWGLWTGVALALALVALIEFTYLGRTDWELSVQAAQRRNYAC